MGQPMTHPATAAATSGQSPVTPDTNAMTTATPASVVPIIEWSMRTSRVTGWARSRIRAEHPLHHVGFQHEFLKQRAQEVDEHHKQQHRF